MPHSHDNLGIVHNEAESRFQADLDGPIAFLSYRRSGKAINLIHTEVPEGHEGQGIGGSLARAALDHARTANLKVIPSCPFVADYIRSHPEYAGLV